MGDKFYFVISGKFRLYRQQKISCFSSDIFALSQTDRSEKLAGRANENQLGATLSSPNEKQNGLKSDLMKFKKQAKNKMKQIRRQQESQVLL